MPRGKTKTDQPADGGQVNFKASPALFRRLQRTADALGLDLANLARMIVSENLPAYEERARRLLPPDQSS